MVLWVLMLCDSERTQKKLAICFAGFMVDLLFDPEDGGGMFLKNVGLPPNYVI
jgi:hypothetical protein